MVVALVVTAGLIGWLNFAPGDGGSTESGVAAGGFGLAQLAEPTAPLDVSEAELATYLDVYKAMQSDHAKQIEEAIEPHGISLSEFRDIERRVQRNSGLIDRVRRELLAHAQEVSIFGNAATPSPSPKEQP